MKRVRAHTLLSPLMALLAALALCLPVCAAEAEADSTAVHKSLSAKLNEYLELSASAPVEVKMEDADELISACRDSVLRITLAEVIFEHYRLSNLMGDEAVAVHIARKWHLGGKAADFAAVNSQSLVGMKAPSLSPVVDTLCSGGKSYTLLYFYDSDCHRCQEETPRIVSLVGRHPEFDFVAFYVGTDRASWESHIREYFPQDFPVRHFSDPERLSGFQMKYAVDGTPRLFLISSDGIILGRRLQADVTEELLDKLDGLRPAGYGSELSSDFFDALFGGYGSGLTADDINILSDYIAAKAERSPSLAEQAESKQLLGDLLYYLASHSGEAYKESADHLVRSHILSENSIWTSEEDSLRIVSYARMLDDLFSRTRPGRKIAAVRVGGDLYRCGAGRGKASGCRARQRKVRLDRLHGDRNIILFHVEGCRNCARELDAAEESGRRGGSSSYTLFTVNLSEVERENPALFRRLADAFDFTVTPFLIETDRNGIIVRRYFSLSDPGLMPAE